MFRLQIKLKLVLEQYTGALIHTAWYSTLYLYWNIW